MSSLFDVPAEELSKLVADKSIEKLISFVGVNGLAKKLHTDTITGLSTFDKTGSASVFVREDQPTP
jgi:hypothetical protein